MDPLGFIQELVSADILACSADRADDEECNCPRHEALRVLRLWGMGRETRQVGPTLFVAYPEHGGWFEAGHDPASEETGYLCAPMLADGSFDPSYIGEVEVPYSQA